MITDLFYVAVTVLVVVGLPAAMVWWALFCDGVIG